MGNIELTTIFIGLPWVQYQELGRNNWCIIKVIFLTEKQLISSTEYMAHNSAELGSHIAFPFFQSEFPALLEVYTTQEDHCDVKMPFYQYKISQAGDKTFLSLSCLTVGFPMLVYFEPHCVGTPDALTHCCRDKMAAIFQTTFSYAFSWMKINDIQSKFHWSLFLTFQLTIFQHWFR